MERTESAEPPPFQQGQSLILSHLVRASMKMGHIDDLLSWLVSTAVQQFEVQLMQLWAVQTTVTGQTVAVLRADAGKDPSLPQHIVYNTNVSKVVANFLRLRQGMPLQPVKSYFPLHQTTLFLRYGLNYCSGQFLHSEAILPPSQTASFNFRDATPLAILSLQLWRDIPSLDGLSTLTHIVEQAIPIARLRNLLIDPSALQYTPAAPLQSSPPLAELVPHRQETQAMRSDSPFARAISDKTALRLYQVVDGRKTVAEIAYLLGLDEKTMAATLSTLYRQELIRLYDAAGHQVNVIRLRDLLSQ